MSKKTSTQGYVRFLGDYAELKSLGYGFQKLYARNHQQWHKEGVRVWRKGAEVTFDPLMAHLLAQLIQWMSEAKGGLTYEPSRTFKNTSFLRCYINTETGLMTQDRSEYDVWIKKIATEDADSIPNFNFNLWESKAFTPESLSPLQELLDKGWLKVVNVGISEKTC